MTISSGYIPLCVPEIRGNEWKYIKQCLDEGWVSSVGGFVEQFEREVASRLGVGYGLATASGTAALHVALLAAKVEPEDEVLVSALTFVAPANAVRYVGAWPVFVDAEPEFWQIDPEKTVDFLDRRCIWRDGALHNRESGRRVRALMPVHILGHPVDIDPLLEVANRYGLVVIEDATESLGAIYKGRKVGHLGDIACFSFNGNKVVTTGGGGMIVTDHQDWAERVRYLATQAKDDPVEYIHGEVGYNYRLTNIQAAMGMAQLEQLDEFIAAKKRIAARYGEGLGGMAGIRLPKEAEWVKSIWWLYTIRVQEEKFGIDSRELMRRLQTVGIQSRPLWHPLHLSPAHTRSMRTDCQVAECLYKECLSLPSSVGLFLEEQERVVRGIAEMAR